jgi:hypothetical protein
MNSRLIIIAVMCLVGCQTVERRDCLDWRHYIVRDEICTAMYGNIICVEQDVTRYYCVLWEDKDVADIDRASRRTGGGSL